jgi:molybdate transport system substrate-binding protein
MKRINLAIAGIALIAVGVFFGTRASGPVKSEPAGSRNAAQNELIVLCPAGLRKPAEACANEFTAATGVQVRFQFGGSGQLLTQLAAGAPADIFIPADASYLQIGRDKKLLRESVPLAEQHPVIAVRDGNPKAITGLDKLLAPGVRFALANPEAASIGRTVKEGLKDRYPALAAAATVNKMTVTDLLTDLQIGSVDAAIVWNSTAHGVKDVVAVEDPALATLIERPIASVTEACKKPAVALSFIRWMASPEHGNPVWKASGFKPVAGDAWAVKPTVNFYCGSVNRIAIEKSLKDFADREGAEINTVYNGCGILCASMKQMADDKQAMPDAYYACDICFVPPVAEHFPEAFILTEAAIVIAVPKGNPKNIKTLEDLAKPGLKIGIGNAKQSTLGYMTSIMLGKIKKAVEANAVSQVPQGDLLVTQLRTGSIDAAIVYNTNAKPQAEFVDIVPLYVPGAKAMQPFAVGKESPNAQLAGRMLDFLRANKERFVDAGFTWKENQDPVKSNSLSTDPADANRP